MATFVLTDVAHDVWVESFATGNETLGLPADGRWGVSKRRLRGGRRDGVDLIQVSNGPLEFSIVPTRGMNLWNGSHLGLRLGWDSPVADGPVNPAFVNLSGLGGLGWLDGFDELLSRCGLAWSGAPFEVKALKPDGSESHTTFGLHGKIANIPASYVAVHIGDSPPHEIVVEGHVEESHLFGPRIRMITRISTTPGADHLVVRDEFVNLGDQPTDMQVLYHWNFGPPLAGGRIAVRRAVPDDHPARPPRRGGTEPPRRLRPARARERPSRSTSTSCTPARAGAARRWPCSGTRRETGPSCCGSTRTSFPASRSGRTPPAAATAT